MQDIKDLVIAENSVDFNPKDIDEIQLSIGWTEQKYIDDKPLWTHYDMHRTYDYVAVAKIGDKAVGILDAFSDRDNFATSYLYSIMVHKDYQKRGIGRALMNAFNKHFAHTTTWAITPISKNKDAVSFLEKFGFNETPNFTVCWRKRDEQEGFKCGTSMLNLRKNAIKVKEVPNLIIKENS